MLGVCSSRLPFLLAKLDIFDSMFIINLLYMAPEIHPDRQNFENWSKSEEEHKKARESGEEEMKSLNPVKKISGWFKADKHGIKEDQYRGAKERALERAQNEAEQFNQFLDWLLENSDKYEEWVTASFGGRKEFETYIHNLRDIWGKQYDDEGQGTEYPDHSDFIKKNQNKFVSWISNYFAGGLSQFQEKVEKGEFYDFKNMQSKKSGRKTSGSDDFVSRDAYDRRVRQEPGNY